MLTMLPVLLAAACGHWQLQELKPPQVMACAMETTANVQTCVKSAEPVENLFRAENASVARLLFSLSARTDEATVLHALQAYKESALPETRCKGQRIASGRRWLVPTRSNPRGSLSVLEVRFVGGRVASAKWRPTPALAFDAAYIVVVGEGWRPPPEVDGEAPPLKADEPAPSTASPAPPGRLPPPPAG